MQGISLITDKLQRFGFFRRYWTSCTTTFLRFPATPHSLKHRLSHYLAVSMTINSSLRGSKLALEVVDVEGLLPAVVEWVVVNLLFPLIYACSMDERDDGSLYLCCKSAWVWRSKTGRKSCCIWYCSHLLDESPPETVSPITHRCQGKACSAGTTAFSM